MADITSTTIAELSKAAALNALDAGCEAFGIEIDGTEWLERLCDKCAEKGCVAMLFVTPWKAGIKACIDNDLL